MSLGLGVQHNFSCCQQSSNTGPLGSGNKPSSVGLLGEVPGGGCGQHQPQRELVLVYGVIYVRKAELTPNINCSKL